MTLWLLGFPDAATISADEGIALAESIGDPFTLGDRLRKLAGQEVVFGIRRNESKNTQTIKNVKVTPRQPTVLSENRTADPIAIDEIGVAFRVLNWVVHVEPGSPADVAGIRRGDGMG